MTISAQIKPGRNSGASLFEPTGAPLEKAKSQSTKNSLRDDQPPCKAVSTTAAVVNDHHRRAKEGQLSNRVQSSHLSRDLQSPPSGAPAVATREKVATHTAQLKMSQSTTVNQTPKYTMRNAQFPAESYPRNFYFSPRPSHH